MRVKISFDRFKERLGQRDLQRSLLIAVIFAILWWLASILLSLYLGSTHVWGDQRVNFTQVGHHLADPYQMYGFVNPVWTALLLFPFSQIPLSLAVLLQLCLYFMLLALLAHQYGGSTQAVILTVTSYIALDLAFEPNIDWLVYLGLLLPASLGAPLLVIKPQLALGAWFGYELRDVALGILVIGLVVLLSILVWGWWVPDMLNAIDRYTTSEGSTGSNVNLAPASLMPPVLSYLIGIALAVYAFRRKDPALGILAWLFFTPYLGFYSTLLYFMIMAVRYPLLAKIIYATTWLIYGGALLYGLLFVYS